ncbi:F0F1 ATP synthase subunit A [Marinilongibacter aquaticus]|uniref:F0F1 ATP synthase subunit A n=1 Tax=Marinilongibacter aquaticus TaxID=2975157 RepID=UPI0021BD42F0|nr:F0F1 ATP synthase subunit A [Marinilongibacter aquaticus]UBM60460.1 F0F1 ATP synthase subunit A [Marinilongibacter aquaticus]
MVKKILLALSFSVLISGFAQAQHEAEASHETHAESEEFNMGEMIMHHVLDAHEWEFAHGLTLHLPVILYSEPHGLDVFSSAHLYENGGTYGPYSMHHEKITLTDDHEAKVWDFSITKNVASLLLSAIILLLVFTAVLKGYKKNVGKAPSGLQSLMEPVITTIRDEVVKPNIGPKYEAYLPYLLTLFFFILVNNLMGLTPGAANLTGNIAVTASMALITFVIVHFKANKNYWMHIVAPPGVPGWLMPLFWIIEIIGVLMKPASLAIRLFANITGGHIIILSFIGIIFLFKNYAVGGGVWLIGSMMSLIEILVAFIQAYIFTLLSSMYIGSAIEEHHDH